MGAIDAKIDELTAGITDPGEYCVIVFETIGGRRFSDDVRAEQIAWFANESNVARRKWPCVTHNT